MPSEWTVDTQRVYFERVLVEMDARYTQRFDAQERAVNAALAATKEAVTKAEVATERRLEAMNEFRKQLSEQAATFASREMMDARLQPLERRDQESKGRGAGLKDLWGYLVAAVALGVSAIEMWRH